MILITLRATFFRLYEMVRVAFRYYRYFPFFGADLLLGGHYLLRNPHQLSKAFMKKRGEKMIYAYGETPLTTLDRIARECRILSKDVVYELGCGSGRTVFWLSHFVKCRAYGVEYQPTFVHRANRVKRWCHLDRPTFLFEDMLNVDYSQATVLYLYGTCLDEEMIHKLIDRFLALKSGTKIITVSYPLTEYSNAFTLEKHFQASFPWGKADIFLNIRKKIS